MRTRPTDPYFPILLFTAIFIGVGAAKLLAKEASPQPVGRWLASQESDSVLHDSASGELDGQILSQLVQREESSPSGSALVFDGADDETVTGPSGFAIVPIPDGFDCEAGFSISLWARPDASSAFAPFSTRTTDPEKFSDGFGIFFSEGCFGAFVRSSEDISNVLVGPSAATNVWAHLCLTYDGAVSSLYVNGSLAAATTNAAGTAAASGPLVFGTVVGTETAYPLTGALADVRLFSTPLSPVEVSRLHAQMSKGANEPSTGPTGVTAVPSAGKSTSETRGGASQTTPSATEPRAGASDRRLCVGVRRRASLLRVATPLE